MPKLIVPKLSDPYLHRLLTLVDATHEPILVEVEPEPSTQINDCFNIVHRKVECSGGKRICGWQITKGKFIIEAEAHAVWERPDGTLEDLTPKIMPWSKILFVEDEKLTYHGKQINSFRLNMTANKIADDLIILCERIFEFENYGQRADNHDLTALLNEQQKKHWIALQQWRQNLSLFLNSGAKPTSPCYCNSGLTFDICHRPFFLQWIKMPLD